MGDLFENLCRGPVVVIDDRIGDEEDLINKLIGEIKNNKLPVLSYKSPYEVKNELPGLLFSNFIILDWKFVGVGDPTIGIITGDEAEKVAEQEVIEFIKDLKKICLAPIFILSAFDKDWIISKLEAAGIMTGGKNYVFVESKDVLCQSPGNLISTIEKWIADSPHVYLAKSWSNEWLTKNTMVFWDLYDLNPNWPTLFYHAFKEDGVDPILALRDTLFQLIFSEINVSEVKHSFLNRQIEEKDEESQKESLKDLYKRLVYIHNDIDKDIRPGDIFKKEGSYYLNIRPECDTTKRAGSNPEIYLLKGDVKTPKDVKGSYVPPYGIIEKENQIIMFFLDGNDIVVFNKRKLSIKKYSEMKHDKICRVASPFITKMRQSYSSYLGRFGVPSYPSQIVDSLFESKEEISVNGDVKLA